VEARSASPSGRCNSSQGRLTTISRMPERSELSAPGRPLGHTA